jgi:hypothetical protein
VIDLQGSASSHEGNLPSEDPPTTYQILTTIYQSEATVQAPTSPEDQAIVTTQPADTATAYWQQDDPWGSQTPTASTSIGPVSTECYQPQAEYASVSYSNHSTVATQHGGYYSPAAPAVDWLSTAGDPGAFIGTGHEYDPTIDSPVDVARRHTDPSYFHDQAEGSPMWNYTGQSITISTCRDLSYPLIRLHMFAFGEKRWQAICDVRNS